MAIITELLLMTGILATFYTLELNTPDKEEPIADMIEEIVEKYENSKSLYDLIAHFPVDEDIKCPDSDTRLPYPGDCTRYITCRDFKAHIRGCPPGFKFDRESLNCKYAFQVKCNNSVEVDHICGANEFYSECGPTCETSCEEINDEYHECPKECVKGCFCKEGFVRGPLRMCVPPRKCKTSNMLEPWFLINAHKKLLETDKQDNENLQSLEDESM